MTDKAEVPGDTSGKKKVLVTITSEAFGLVIFANCRDKWIADFQFKASNKKAKIPKYNKEDPATHKYQNKWSSSRTGQVQGGGWDNEALQYCWKKIFYSTRDKDMTPEDMTPRQNKRQELTL